MALAAPIPIDANAAAQHLGEAVRFQTVSHQDPKADDPKAWDDQRAWLQTTYPKFHAVAQREVIGAGTLVYTWKGTDPTLPAVVLMAHQDVVPVSAGTDSPMEGAAVFRRDEGRMRCGAAAPSTTRAP